ncbi:MAG: hypothetical protein A3E78_11915 [Alphaproteobacteria bacterium RIFCSPHIGHO2_12_FULL_63_12]|nr:MAG: hypothetical protein A3E78_11915 [Alphaproteobacteria bacterium RIFCSPHIGHO2_12_FULL_63_12]
MSFAWKAGYPARIDASKAVESLDQIRTSNGGAIAAEDIVEAARDPSSALHAQFSWDDALAAEEFRRVQARTLLRSILVVEEGQPPRPYFITIEEHREERSNRFSYVRLVEDVLPSQTLVHEVLERALRELESWRAKYAQLAQLSQVHKAIDREVERQKKKKLVETY